jgi:hypothetical protein
MSDLRQQLRASRTPVHGQLFRICQLRDDIDAEYAKRLKDPHDMVALRRMLAEQRERALLVKGTAHLDIPLARPFRKPPLRYPSRFGRVTDPGIFYASRAPITCLAEKAYYQFRFLHDPHIPPPEPLEANYSLILARYATHQGIPLDAPRWQARRAEITSPSDYSLCQRLGRHARELKVAAIEFPSARLLPYLAKNGQSQYHGDQGRGECNIALLAPNALAGTTPQDTFRVTSRESRNQILFILWGWNDAAFPQPFFFDLAPLLVNGTLPIPR